MLFHKNPGKGLSRKQGNTDQRIGLRIRTARITGKAAPLLPASEKFRKSGHAKTAMQSHGGL